MQVVAWLRYIIEILNAVVAGVEVVISRWPASRPGSDRYGKSAIKNTDLDKSAGKQEPI
jgi:hypothetical protein